MFLVRNPSALHHPSDIARNLVLRDKLVHEAINKLYKRLGVIRPEALCPSCLLHSRFGGACQNCGLEIIDTSQTSPTLQTLQNSSPIFQIHSEEIKVPIKIDIRSRDYLKGDRIARITAFILSRLEQLFKKYYPEKSVTNKAALIAKRVVEEYCKSHEQILAQHKLAILTSIIRECERKMPNLNRMWEEMINNLLEMPEVILYSDKKGRKTKTECS
jgi:hypothetical protein